MSTFSEIARSVIGTTGIEMREDDYSSEGFVAVHYEKIRGGVKPVQFRAATRFGALRKAARYDQLRRAKFAKWKTESGKRKVKAAER